MAAPSAVKTIVAVQGASNPVVQALLADIVTGWRARGVKIVGVVEQQIVSDARSRPASVLRDIVTGLTYPISQDLGPGSTSCRLDARGVVDACHALLTQIAAGCDLVVLSKFGKLEAARTGLAAAFIAAVEAETPILTAVAPSLDAAWRAFAGPLAGFLPASHQALETWWETSRLTRGTPALVDGIAEAPHGIRRSQPVADREVRFATAK